eukprot:986443_1
MLNKGSARRGQRLHPGSFSLKPPSRAQEAQVQLNRFGQQLKKKLKHIDSSRVRLIILLFCALSMCYIVLTIVYTSSESTNQTDNFREAHNKINDANANSELGAHHLTMNSKEHAAPKQPVIQRDATERTEVMKDKEKVTEILTTVNDEQIVTNWDAIWSTISTVDISSNISINSDTLSERSYAIKSAFLHAWHGYAKHALGHDEILPVSDVASDSWGGLGATLIDSLDTMMIMQLDEEFKVAREQLHQVKFDIDLKVSFFETTIRHLGGLIGAYEMTEDKFILQQAITLGDHLLPAFNTRSGMPKSMVNLQSGGIENYGWSGDKSVLSEVASNQLEFYALSGYTDEGKYYAASSKVYSLLDEAQAHGEYKLYPRLIETNSASFAGGKVYSLGGMSDSFYEYTLKLWILTSYNDQLALKMYIESVNAANEKLLRMVNDKRRRQAPYYFYGEEWNGQFRGKMEELTCFMPGVLALGSYHALLREQESNAKPLSKYEQALVDDREKHLKLAHVLLESCVALYHEMPTGLAPESIQFNHDSWEPKEMKYQLRPETLESLFIMWSLTGNDEYREWAWNIFESIQKHCKTDVAYSGIEDVTVIPAKQDNQMQSYVMAETFKYLFLLFDDYAAKLLPLDKFVFNTEAHPIRIISDITKYKWYNADGDGETETVAV